MSISHPLTKWFPADEPKKRLGMVRQKRNTSLLKRSPRLMQESEGSYLRDEE